MLGKIKELFGKGIKKIIPYAIATAVIIVGETNGTTTTFDAGSMMNVIYAVLPVVLMVYVLRVLFRSFRDLGS